MSSFDLMRQRRFAPFFGVQFLGALNDNLFKNALVIMLAFRAASESESGFLINLAAGLFILPFFLFSAVAGQIADKYEKATVMRAIKLAEVGIMAIGAVGFFTGWNVLLFVTLFLMGVHSAFFGPVKYSILPQALAETELMAGNALVEMGTFLAILIGTLAGGLLAGSNNAAVISAGIVGVAAAGYGLSRLIPQAPATTPQLQLKWNPLTETAALWRLTRKKEGIFNAILGISWFWYFGATMLAQLPNFTKHFLQADEAVVTVLLATFSVAIGVGSILCEKLSRGEIELGLVPLGALGMTVFCADLFFISYPAGLDHLRGVQEFLTGDAAGVAYRVLFDLSMVGLFSSLFIVPLYAFIQNRSDEDARSRVIAANNVFNAVFMVASALITMALYQAGFNTLGILFFTAILNFVVCTYVFALLPEFVMRFFIWVLASTIYRLRYEGRDEIPRKGAAVIVANHVSFIDWFVITAACRRPVRFVMDHRIFKMPVIGLLFKAAKAIPIAPAKEDAALKEKAFERIAAELKDDQIVCIFPEGKITYDGRMDAFKPGVEQILKTTPVPVVPMAITGLWGSFFSRKNGRAMKGVPHPSRREIGVRVAKPLSATANAGEMQAVVGRLLGDDAAPRQLAATGK